MANNPPTTGIAKVYYIGLQDAGDSTRLKSNPTIAAGDFKVVQDDGSLTNLTTLPTLSPAGGKRVKISFSAAEFTGNNITLVCSDQTDPPEWGDKLIDFPTTV